MTSKQEKHSDARTWQTGMTAIDQAILDALGCHADDVSFQSCGSSFSKTGKLKVGQAYYFLKCSEDEKMIAGEAASYRAISAACPDFCPAVIATGQCTTGDYFLLSSFLHFSATTSLAQSLVALHSTTSDAFGFETSTCCADTAQDNTWTLTWHEFFIERRLKPISKLRSNASDSHLQALVTKVSQKALPRLLDALDIKPSLIHGDLWSGNTRGNQVFDACSCFAHSEFELSIMYMFGGLSSVIKEYHAMKPRDAPVGEYDDRIALYQCYHQLNHSGTGQGESYKDSAKQTLQRLVDKYG